MLAKKWLININTSCIYKNIAVISDKLISDKVVSSSPSSQRSLTGKKQAMATYVHNRWRKKTSFLYVDTLFINQEISLFSTASCLWFECLMFFIPDTAGSIKYWQSSEYIHVKINNTIHHTPLYKHLPLPSSVPRAPNNSSYFIIIKKQDFPSSSEIKGEFKGVCVDTKFPPLWEASQSKPKSFTYCIEVLTP